MEFNLFKDKLFELLNENDDIMDIADIEADDSGNTFALVMTDGSSFGIQCRQC